MSFRSSRKRGRRRTRSRRGRSYESTTAWGGKISSWLRAGFWKRRRAKILSLLLLGFLAWLTTYFFTSYDFFVYQATIIGNETVPTQEIYGQSGLDSLSIFFVDPSQVEAAVSQIVAIKEVKVRCQLPNRVIIEVEERQPQATLQTAGRRYWVDSEGMILPARGDLGKAPLIQDLDDSPLQPGDKIDVEAIRTAQRLKALLPQINSFGYSRSMGISLTSPEGWLVYFGTTGNLEGKIAAMKALEREIATRKPPVEFIDLRFGERPYIEVGSSSDTVEE